MLRACAGRRTAMMLRNRMGSMRKARVVEWIWVGWCENVEHHEALQQDWCPDPVAQYGRCTQCNRFVQSLRRQKADQLQDDIAHEAGTQRKAGRGSTAKGHHRQRQRQRKLRWIHHLILCQQRLGAPCVRGARTQYYDFWDNSVQLAVLRRMSGAERQAPIV